MRGPCLFLGYLDSSQTSQAFDAAGYFRTGDVGYLRPDDAILVTARKKDIIIRGGENISPKEIEDALHGHWDFVEAVAVAMPHPRLGEVVCAFAITRDAASLTLASITAHLLSSGFARQECPERLELLDEFPRTPSGKVRKDLLRACDNIDGRREGDDLRARQSAAQRRSRKAECVAGWRYFHRLSGVPSPKSWLRKSGVPPGRHRRTPGSVLKP